MAWLAAAVCVSLVGLIATFVTRGDDPQLGPVGSTTSQTPQVFTFDDMPTVAHCVTYQGYGTAPAEGRAVLLVSESSDRFYETELTFDDSGRWLARDVVVGTAEDAGHVFDLMVFAVTPDVADQLAALAPSTPVTNVPGRLLGQTRVTRSSAPGTC